MCNKHSFHSLFCTWLINGDCFHKVLLFIHDSKMHGLSFSSLFFKQTLWSLILHLLSSSKILTPASLLLVQQALLLILFQLFLRCSSNPYKKSCKKMHVLYTAWGCASISYYIRSRGHITPKLTLYISKFTLVSNKKGNKTPFLFWNISCISYPKLNEAIFSW